MPFHPPTSSNRAAPYCSLWRCVRGDNPRLPSQRDSFYISCRQQDLTTPFPSSEQINSHLRWYRARGCKTADWKGVSAIRKDFFALVHLTVLSHMRKPYKKRQRIYAENQLYKHSLPFFISKAVPRMPPTSSVASLGCLMIGFILGSLHWRWRYEKQRVAKGRAC